MIETNINRIIDASKTYYNWLCANKKGRSETQASRLRPAKITGTSSAFVIQFPHSIRTGENDILKINGIEYSFQDAGILGCDERRGTITLAPPAEQLKVFEQNCASAVYLISDLTFLVKRVINWYENHGSEVALPSVPAPSSILDAVDFSSLSDEQAQAVRGAFTHPLTYIWGAPGTGKTSAVLAQCLLAYIKQEEQIVLLAPTNNAIDQVLSVVIPLLEEGGIERTAIRRCGVPTQEFLQKYPDVCEASGLEFRKLSLKNDLNKYQRYRKAMKVLDDIRGKYSEVLSILEQCAALLEKADAAAAQNTDLSESFDLEAAIDQAQVQCNLYEVDVRSAEDALKLYQREYDSFRERVLRFFSSSHKRKSLETLMTAQDRCHACTRDLLNAEAEYKRLCAQRTKYESTLAALRDSFLSLASQAESCMRRINISPQPILFTHTSVAEAIEHLTQLQEEEEGVLWQQIRQELGLAELAEEELKGLEQAVQEKLERLTEEEQSSYKNVFLLAATVDSYIARLYTSVVSKPSSQDMFTPKHIFLDEAGYCCLAKVFPIFSDSHSVTFLGDHLQLPPVCEMNTFTADCADCFVWSQSAIYAEQAFYMSLDDMHAIYSQADIVLATSAPSEYMRTFSLTRSFRFGQNLAELLGREVYNLPLTGGEQGTQLLLLSVSHTKKGEKRTSPDEAEAIANYIMQNNPQDYAVLAPYRAQVDLIKKHLPAVDRTSVMTVHKSQGKEWDTIFFSVTDTMNAFLVVGKRGRRLINTAISRAKRCLVIVCDADYWSSRSGRLITKVINLAERANS